MTYINANLSAAEALRLHGHALPAAWRGHIETAASEISERDSQIEELQTDIEKAKALADSIAEERDEMAEALRQAHAYINGLSKRVKDRDDLHELIGVMHAALNQP